MIVSSIIMLILDGVYYSFITASYPVDKWSQYAVYELIAAFGEPFFTGGLAWATATAREPMQRSMYAALYVMASNSGQAIGPQMFRAYDAPK